MKKFQILRQNYSLFFTIMEMIQSEKYEFQYLNFNLNKKTFKYNFLK
jgi:hypothetical protein